MSYFHMKLLILHKFTLIVIYIYDTVVINLANIYIAIGSNISIRCYKEIVS